jgi:hypothetical protein
MWALRETVENLPRVARDPEDREAKQQMLSVASCLRARTADAHTQARRILRGDRFRQRRRAPLPRNELSGAPPRRVAARRAG